MRFFPSALQLTACSTSAYLLPVFLVSSSQDGMPRIPSRQPQRLRPTVPGMEDRKSFMMMAPMSLPHCPGMGTHPRPTAQHPVRQLNDPLSHRPTDGSPTRGETLQCVRNCWHDKNCHLPEDMITRMPHATSARCICSLSRCSCPLGNEADFAYPLEMMRSSLTLTNPHHHPRRPRRPPGCVPGTR